MGGKKILVAEDDPSVRKMTADFLAKRGYAVTTAEDGVAACEAAATQKPDVVVLDLLLPRRDGYAVLLHLRSQPATKSIPVVILSGESAEEHEQVALALGANGYIPKPFASEKLLAMIESVLKEGR